MDEQRIPFHDPSQFPHLGDVASQWMTIRDELFAGLPKAYSAYDSQDLTSPGTTWQKISLFAWGLEVPQNTEAFPKTAELVRTVPRLMQATFYILGGHSHILPHTGVTGLVLRAHIGISCPPSDCALRVADEVQSHENGKLMVFDDTFEHEAWNRSDQSRYVLHFDFFYDHVPPEKQQAVTKAIRQTVCRANPRRIPAFLVAGIKVDKEVAKWFAENNLTFSDDYLTPTERSAFNDWVASSTAGMELAEWR
jgi:aspartyl/asparaginyl beta-hydroxylase (cupin superfamily)